MKPQYPGKIFVQCNPDGADQLAYVPPATDYAGSKLICYKGVAANAVQITASTLGPINGDSAFQIQLDNVGDCVVLVSDGVSWRYFNANTVIL